MIHPELKQVSSHTLFLVVLSSLTQTRQKAPLKCPTHFTPFLPSILRQRTPCTDTTPNARVSPKRVVEGW